MIKAMDRKIVIGLRGVADFIIENIDVIRNGGSVVFAVETEAGQNDDMETVAANSTGWYGIEESGNAANFDCADEWLTVLYGSYYGYTRSPMVHAIDWECADEHEAESLTGSIVEMVACGEFSLPSEDAQIYVECREKETSWGLEHARAVNTVCLHCLFSGVDGENCDNCPVRKTMDKLADFKTA